MNSANTLPTSPRWSFSLRGLMLLVVMAAIAVMTGKDLVVDAVDLVRVSLVEIRQPQPLFGTSWNHLALMSALWGIGLTVMIPTAACMAFSLVQHAAVLVWRDRPNRNDGLPRKCGWCFDVFGRVMLAILLVSYVNLDESYSHGQTEWPRLEDPSLIEMFRKLREAAFLIALLAALAWSPHPAQEKPRRRGWIIHALAAPAMVVICMAVWMSATMVHSLVYDAVLGMEQAGPLKFVDPATPLLASQRIELFWTRALVASIAAIGCAISCRRLGRVWDDKLRWRAVCAVVLVLGWAIQLWFLHWVYPAGMHELSPALAESLIRHEAPLLWLVAAALALLSILAAYRAARQPASSFTTASQAARHYRYFYEGRIALALVTIAAALATTGYALIDIDTSACLWMALLAFCAGRWWRLWRDRLAGNVAQWDLPPLKFVVCWLTTFITLATGTATLGLFSFVNWLGPWIHWRLFELV
jgi:hypothetical protein